MARRKELDNVREELRQAVRGWAAEHDHTVHVEAIESPWHGVHVGIGSPSFAGRPWSDFQNSIWDYLRAHALTASLKISRLYLFEDPDFSEADLHEMLEEEQSA